MESLIKALELTLESNNWYGALFIALSMPDICGCLQNPEEGVRARYERWFERYMLSKYSKHVRPEKTPHTFLSSSDCYALRCVLLHEGRDVIEDQKAREMLRRFHFIEPPPKGSFIHLNQFNDVLMLQVDRFCRDIIDGVQQWLKDVQSNKEVESHLKNLLVIHQPNKNGGFPITLSDLE